MTLKFAFIVGALTVAVLSYVICYSRRDWAWLVGGLAFTVGADFFLVLHDWHLPGVAVFCFAHVCYISRALELDVKSAWKLFLAVSLAVLITAYLGVIWVAVLYAGLFITNIMVNTLWFKKAATLLSEGSVAGLCPAERRGFGGRAPIENKKTCLPKRNRALVLTGLLLFSLCDVNVLLFNLPNYINVEIPSWTFYLIWFFYIPAQVLLAISAVSFKRTQI